ncbi:MAG: hypothetical protein EZS28_024823 [Streblomastix strix]|uniref:Uncharacterized protein n=1 Tax=Streblomastix strix TaxID=222440 RepID=A0A5J4VAQ7_9EUKA|nr:MAG: hypothetical protein EZS28_024823 [Streblomastix strix]
MSLSSFNEDNYAYKSFNAIVSFASVVSIPASSLQSQDETQLAQLGTISSSRDKHQQSNSEYNQLIWYKTLIELCNLGCDAKTILSSLHSECISPLICAFLHLLLLRQEQKEYETIPQQISVILGQLGINHTNIVSIGQIQPNSNSCVNLPFKQLALSTLRFIGGCPDILMKDAAESLVNLIRFQIPQIYRANDFGQQAIIEAISLSPNESIRVLVENPTFLTLFEEKNILRLVRLLIDFAKQWRK